MPHTLNSYTKCPISFTCVNEMPDVDMLQHERENQLSLSSCYITLPLLIHNSTVPILGTEIDTLHKLLPAKNIAFKADNFISGLIQMIEVNFF